MSQPATFPRVSAKRAMALVRLARRARGLTFRPGRVHSTPDSWRHSSQLPWDRPSRAGARYERAGGSMRDRARYSREQPEQRLFGKP